MFKVIVLFALIAAVYSVPAPAAKSGPTGETTLEVPNDVPVPSVASDNKEVLDGAASSYVAVGAYPFAGRYSYYPEYYRTPIIYTHPLHRNVLLNF